MLEVHHWQYHYKGDRVVPATHLLSTTDTCLLVVHAWGVDDGVGPNSADGEILFFGNAKKNGLVRRHMETVLDPFVETMRWLGLPVAWTVPDYRVHISTVMHPTEEDWYHQDAEGFPAFRERMGLRGIKNLILCGYATDLCVKDAPIGWVNARPHFGCYLVEDATAAAFPAADSWDISTDVAVRSASVHIPITRQRCIKLVENNGLSNTQ